MIKNYLLVSVRNLIRQKFFFVLNVLGLSLGIASCLLCYLHIQNELSYDTWHKKSSDIYRLVVGDVPGGQGWVKVSAPIPPKIKQEVPEVIEYVRLTKATYESKIIVRHNDKILSEEDFFLSDASIFDVFDFQLTRGQTSQVLADRNSVVISESAAERYFDEGDPIGQTITVNNQFEFTVSGIFEDVPDNSHITFDFLVSFANLERLFPGTSLTANWTQYNYYAYVLLHPESDVANARNNIHDVEVNLGGKQKEPLYNIHLQPLSSIHFEPNRGNTLPSYKVQYLYIYSAIALGILIISFINFVNLSTAGSTKRIKEVGVRKVMGATRYQLIYQFISESFIVTTTALLIAVILIEWLILPYFNSLLNTHIVVNYSDPSMLFAFVVLLGIIGITSGSYLAFFIASFSPAVALRGSLKTGKRGEFFKNFLLTVQFVISLVLVLSSIFIYRQLHHMKNKDIGFNTSQVLTIPLFDQESREKADILKQELTLLPSVESVSASRYVAGEPNWNQTVWWEGQEESVSMMLIETDEQFLETLEIELLEGDYNTLENNLSKGEIKYLLNEAALSQIGWTEGLGKSFSAYGEKSKGTISGVVHDFNYRSLHHKVEPCVLVIKESTLPSQLMIKIKSANILSTVPDVKGVFKMLAPNTPFEYGFLNEDFEKLYASEARTSKVVMFLTIIAIALCTLGLYGLISFMVQERTREMAIRKVLGITLPETLILLSKGYLKLFVIANLVGIPVLWFSIDNWLQNFSYKTNMSLIWFLFGSVLILSVLLLTVGAKSILVAKRNPVDGLRHE